MDDCGEPGDDRCLHTGCAEDICAGQVRNVVGDLHNTQLRQTQAQ